MTRRRSHWGTIPAGLLIPLGAAYGGVMRLRRWLYRRGVLRSRPAGAPVICVGNLTVGGTGKTPMTAWLVRRLREMGRRPAILTRGYKASGGWSDEARLLKAATGAPVIVDPNRRAGAARALADGADVLVMDDGFQHLRLRRDLNIVLIDATRPFGGGLAGWCLPAGRMREPLSALRDADVIVFTRTDQISAEEVADLWSRLAEKAPHALLATATHRPVEVIDPAGSAQNVTELIGRKVFVFCGLGNPEAFRRSVASLKAETVGFIALRDHVRYDAALVERLAEEAQRRGAEILLTTQKDGVKLADLPGCERIWRLAVEMELSDGECELLDRIRAILRTG